MDKLNQKLISAGFDAAQSKIILNSINKIITKSIEKSKKSLVSTNQQNEEYKTHFAHLRSEINLLEKKYKFFYLLLNSFYSDFAILKQENEKVNFGKFCLASKGFCTR